MVTQPRFGFLQSGILLSTSAVATFSRQKGPCVLPLPGGLVWCMPAALHIRFLCYETNHHKLMSSSEQAPGRELSSVGTQDPLLRASGWSPGAGLAKSAQRSGRNLLPGTLGCGKKLLHLQVFLLAVGGLQLPGLLPSSARAPQLAAAAHKIALHFAALRHPVLSPARGSSCSEGCHRQPDPGELPV